MSNAGYTAAVNSGPKTLAEFIATAGSLAVLTGAGVSTASGIPDYRDRDGQWKNASPVQYQDFVSRDDVRRRYWARSFAGWYRIENALPNAAHKALAGLESAGVVDTLVTQNVDGLHDAAGSRNTIDLHGRLDTVRCLSCNARQERERWQTRLADANPDWQTAINELRPDGDAEVPLDRERDFSVPDCDRCGGMIKPDVVFFGESVPRTRVDEAMGAVRRSGALLVAGSSLMVFSGFRFARLAVEIGKPVAIVNLGRTRADDFANLKLDGDCGDVLADTAEILEQGTRH